MQQIKDPDVQTLYGGSLAEAYEIMRKWQAKR